MWLSDRRTFLAGMLALAGCGFQPAYGPGGPARKLLGTIHVNDPTDKDGFDLVERLEERLGRPENPAYVLVYRITTKAQGLGITAENAITRYNLAGSVEYSLRKRDDGTEIAAGVVDSFTAYAATGSMLGTEAARQDAQTRLMRLLADQIVTQLVASSGRWGK